MFDQMKTFWAISFSILLGGFQVHCSSNEEAKKDLPQSQTPLQGDAFEFDNSSLKNLFSFDQTSYFFGINSQDSSLSAMAEHHATLGDFDGDGDQDILYWDQGNGAYYLALNQGFGTFEDDISLPPSLVNPTRKVKEMRAADLNQDGLDDLVLWYSGSNSEFLVFARNFGPSQSFNFDPSPPIYSLGQGNLSIGDINGDGKVDVSLSSSSFNESIGVNVPVLLNQSVGKEIQFSTQWINIPATEKMDRVVKTLPLAGKDKNYLVLCSKKKLIVMEGDTLSIKTVIPLLPEDFRGKYNPPLPIQEDCLLGDFDGDHNLDVVSYSSEYADPLACQNSFDSSKDKEENHGDPCRKVTLFNFVRGTNSPASFKDPEMIFLNGTAHGFTSTKLDGNKDFLIGVGIASTKYFGAYIELVTDSSLPSKLVGGNFGTQASPAPRFVMAGDINNDGLQNDLIAMNFLSEELFVFLGVTEALQ